MSAKYENEYQWWNAFLHDQIVPWYRGTIDNVSYYEPIKTPETPGTGSVADAVRTFRQAVAHFYFEQSWQLDASLDYGLILDVGCGPLVPTTVLHGLTFGLDPNIPAYRAMGYPVETYGAVLLPFSAEHLWMIPDNTFDTVVSNNALNHVDNFEKTISEIERVAKPTSFWRFETEYVVPTLAEPHLLDDDRVRKAFTRFSPTKISERHWEGIIGSALWGIGP